MDTFLFFCFILPYLNSNLNSDILWLNNNSKDPEKKQTPMKFVFPGVIVGVLSFIALKYKDNMILN